MKRRFIAGATCPNCKATDTLFLIANDLNGAFECAECGHREEPPEEHEKSIANVANDEIETVKFVDASNPTNGD